MRQKRKPKWMTWSGHYKGGPLSALDSQILHFLWKWKVSPIAVLHVALAREKNPNTFNKRIKKLERNGLIQCHYLLYPSMSLWELTENGFFAIRESLGAIRDHGFRSASQHHDWLVQAFQLGEWLWEEGHKPALITDQELLKYPKDLLSRFLPESDFHRSDGYTLFKQNGEEKLFAIEVELHAKSVERYHTLIRWYAPQMKIQRVLWLVGDPFTLDQFTKAKDEARDTSKRYHAFISVEDYLKNGWNTLVTDERSEKVSTLRDMLRGTVGPECGAYAGTCGVKRDFSIFSDRRKFLSPKGTYEQIQETPVF